MTHFILGLTIIFSLVFFAFIAFRSERRSKLMERERKLQLRIQMAREKVEGRLIAR